MTEPTLKDVLYAITGLATKVAEHGSKFDAITARIDAVTAKARRSAAALS